MPGVFLRFIGGNGIKMGAGETFRYFVVSSIARQGLPETEIPSLREYGWCTIRGTSRFEKLGLERLNSDG